MHSFTLTAGFTLIYLGYSLLVLLFLVLANENRSLQNLFKTNKILHGVSWVGFYSYAIYLFHFFIGFKAVDNLKKLTGEGNPLLIEFGVFIASNILFGYLISVLIEQPVLRWRDKVYPA